MTWTLTAPATWALVLAWTTVGDVTVKLAAVVAPKWTAVAPMNPVPVMVTVVPPLVVPDVGVSEVMVGVGDERELVACPRCGGPTGRGHLDLDGAGNVGLGLGVDNRRAMSP